MEKRVQDYTQDILAVVRSNTSPAAMSDKLGDFHANDIADAMPRLTVQERCKLYRILDTDVLSDIFEYTEEENAAEYLSEMDVKKAAAILSRMETDALADVLNKLEKAKKKIQVFPIVNAIIMILLVIITLYPVLNTLAISLNDGTDALRGGIYLWPRKFTWKNYITVLQKDNLLTGAYITVSRTIIGTVLALVSNAILAFIISRKRFLFKRGLSLFWVITMYVNGGMIPTFLLYKGLGLTNSFAVYVIPGMVSAFNMLVIRTYMNGIPNSLEESAQLDGAGYTTIFLKIYSPLCKPVYATVALFVAVGQWNSWFDAMLYNRMNSSLTTLQYELMKLLSSVTNQGGSAEAMKNAIGAVTPTSVRAAATIITMLPIICIYPFLQKYFVTGLTLGGVKE